MADSALPVPGALLSYEESGVGPVVGYAHGMMLSRRGEDVMGLFDWAPLSRSRRLVRYDARAHGVSTGRPVVDDYGWSNLADDLLAVVERVGGGAPVDWMGASMGCGSLLWAAVKAPDRFRRLVLVIPPTTGDTRVAQAAMYRAGADVVEQDGLASWLRALQQYGLPPIFADIPGFTLDVDVAESLLPSVLRGAAASDLPDVDALAALPHPALVLSWDGDPGHPVSSAELLARTMPNAKLHVSRTVQDVRTWADRVSGFLGE